MTRSLRPRLVATVLVAIGTLVAAAPAVVHACTNIAVTKGASADGSTFITYAADAHTLYGELYSYPAATHAPGAMRDVYEWDTGKYLGKIPEAPVTYSVVGNMNEHQVSVGETTFGGRPDTANAKAKVDYGSLMYIALQRAKTAREAIKVMTDLVAEHGYYSSGESFTIADPEEVWILEMIGKGKDAIGAVWVAQRVPDGHITAHANQARIRRFPLNDPQNAMYSKDVITFAREKGWFKGKDDEFSFADTYNPLAFGGVRFCEARVWSVFRRAAPSLAIPIDYVKGVPGAKPMAWSIKPDRKLGVRDMMELMRDHFEGTELDLSKGVGAGPYELPYRWRPLTWPATDVKQPEAKDAAKDPNAKHAEKPPEFLNERAISTQQTGFSFVAQARSGMPGPIGGVLWFGVDDTASTVYIPMYAGMREIPKPFAVGTADFKTFSWDSAFWVFNFVSNYTYARYRDMIQDVQKVQRDLEAGFLARQPEIDKAALALWQQSPELARDYLTRYSVHAGETTVARWRKLGESLIVKYLDGNVRDEMGKVTHPGYPEAWRKRMADEQPDLLKVGKLPGEPEEEGH